MATSKPRITITLTDKQHLLLQALADVQKVSMSSIVVELLDTAMPVLERLNAILENAAQAPQNVLDELRRSLQTAENDALDAKRQVMGQLDLLAGAPAAKRAHGGARAAAGNPSPKRRPPSTNRGVRIPPSIPRKASGGAASKPVGKGKK